MSPSMNSTHDHDLIYSMEIIDVESNLKTRLSLQNTEHTYMYTYLTLGTGTHIPNPI